MEPGVLVLSIVVGFFGLGSAVLGFIAEGMNQDGNFPRGDGYPRGFTR
jgi:hypothetical protein